MLKHLLLKKVPSPFEGDTQSVPLYKAILYLAIPGSLLIIATFAILL